MAIDPKPIDWRSRRLWHGIGYAVSAAWMVFVLARTGGDVRHPLFDYLFIVPLGLWGAGIGVAWLLKRLAPRG